MEIEHTLLKDIAILSCFVLVLLTITSLIKLPPIVGYFAAGLTVGPSGFAIFSNNEITIAIAELGIIFLMFTLGLKFSINSLFAMRRFVLGLGVLQVFVTMIIFFIPAYYFTESILSASLIGFVAAMSSTALVSQILIQDNALVSPTGRRAMGVLLLQDLIVFPLVALYSSGNEADGLMFLFDNLILLLKACVFLAITYFFGGWLIKKSLDRAVKGNYKEVFAIKLVSIILITAWAAKALGLPDMFGAFLAGILLADSTHKFGVENVVEPMRQLTLGFFFIYVGMLLVPDQIVFSGLEIIYLTILVLLVKIIVLRVCLIFFRTHTFVSWDTAFLLAGCGELGLILLSVGHNSGIINISTLQILLSVNILAMLLTPFIYRKMAPFIQKISAKDDWARSSNLVYKNINFIGGMRNHVIVGGFGRTGQSVIKLLGKVNIPCIAIERDFAVIEAIGLETNLNAGAIHGQYESQSALISVGILRAKALVLPNYDSSCTITAIETARKMNPNIMIIVAIPSAYLAKSLIDAGADKVLVRPLEMGFSFVYECISKIKENLAERKETRETFHDLMYETRELKNEEFLGYYAGSYEEDIPRVFMGCKIGAEFDSSYLYDEINDIKITTWKRGENSLLNKDDVSIKEGDTLVLSGNIINLIRAREKLTQ